MPRCRSVSLPTNSSYRAQTSCNGGYQYCPLATGEHLSPSADPLHAQDRLGLQLHHLQLSASSSRDPPDGFIILSGLPWWVVGGTHLEIIPSAQAPMVKLGPRSRFSVLTIPFVRSLKYPMSYSEDIRGFGNCSIPLASASSWPMCSIWGSAYDHCHI